jgi:hypothetical protein
VRTFLIHLYAHFLDFFNIYRSGKDDSHFGDTRNSSILIDGEFGETPSDADDLGNDWGRDPNDNSVHTRVKRAVINIHSPTKIYLLRKQIKHYLINSSRPAPPWKMSSSPCRRPPIKRMATTTSTSATPTPSRKQKSKDHYKIRYFLTYGDICYNHPCSG